MMKKILGLLVISFMLFFVGDEVKADVLDVNDVASKFNETLVIQILSLGDIDLHLEVDSANNVIHAYNDSKKLTSVTIGNDYLEYTCENFTLNEQNYIDKIYESLIFYGIVDAIFMISGHENIVFDYNLTSADEYDTSGLKLVTEYHELKGTDNESGADFDVNGYFVKYFKVSLDTDKIDKLVEEHGVDINDENFSNEELSGLKPELTFSDVTDTSVTLYASVPDVNINSDLDLSCYIYRSDSEFGEYEKISDFAVSCLGLVGYIDEDLKSDTTYYYKAMVMGGDTYSDVISVTTNKFPFMGSVGADLDDQIGENPKTDSLPIVRLILLLIVNAAIVLIIKKRFLNTYYS